MLARRRLLLLAIVPLVLAATAAGLTLDDDPPARQAERSPPAAPDRTPPRPQLLLVRRRGGVPPSWARRLRRTPGVTAVVRTARAQILLEHSPGYAIPLDTWVVQPRALAGVLPEARRELARLRPGAALLSRTSARLRRLGVGDRLALTDGGLHVAGILDDELAGRAEVVIGRREAGGGNRFTQQLLVETTRPERVARPFSRDDAARVRTVSTAPGSGPSLIARPLEIKSRFGEFAVRLPYGTDWIGIDPAWLRRHIVTRAVPILGPVTCNRRLFGPLRRAMRALQRRGFARVVDPGDYAGCYAPRRIPGSGTLSLHAWGLAIDLNAAANPRLKSSRQNPRLVRAMERAGFTWGGRWPTAPDPMHFELHAPPARR